MFAVIGVYGIDIFFDFTVIFAVDGKKSIFVMMDVVITGEGLRWDVASPRENVCQAENGGKRGVRDFQFLFGIPQ